MTQPRNAGMHDDRSMGHLFSDVTSGVSELIREEMELAKAELRRGMAKLARDLIFLAIGSAVALVALLAFLDAAIYGLGEALPLWLSALIVGGVFLIIAMAMILKGINDLRKGDFMPKQTMESLKEDARWVREQVR